MEGSAGSARECAAATVVEVGRAATRGCAAAAVEGKRDVLLVGIASAFAFALMVVVGIVFFDLVLVGTDGSSRG